MRKSIVTFLCLVGMALWMIPVQAQVFTPAPVHKSGDDDTDWKTHTSITLQGSQLNWNTAGVSSNVGGLLSLDFDMGASGVGLWFAFNGESASGGASGTNAWYEVHGSWYYVKSSAMTVGTYLGVLGETTSASGIGINLTWTEIGEVLSFALDHSASHKSQWTLGVNLGYAIGAAGTDNFGDFLGTPPSGPSYGVALEYRMNKAMSITASYWGLSVANNAAITRASLGIGFHF